MQRHKTAQAKLMLPQKGPSFNHTPTLPVDTRSYRLPCTTSDACLTTHKPRQLTTPVQTTTALTYQKSFLFSARLANWISSKGPVSTRAWWHFSPGCCLFMSAAYTCAYRWFNQHYSYCLHSGACTSTSVWREIWWPKNHIHHSQPLRYKWQPWTQYHCPCISCI